MDKKDKLEVLRKLIEIDTTDKNETTVVEYIESLFEKHDIKSERVNSLPNRDNLVAYLGNKSNKVLGLTGHMDVVSTGNKKEWSSDPFNMTIKDRKIFGRGSSDMKSGLAALIIAMIELKDENVELNSQVKLLATMDEEKKETGAKTLTELGYADDLTALLVAEPSGIKKESLQVAKKMFNIPEEVVNKLVTENKTNEQHFLVFAHSGSVDFKVTSLGKSSHSSMPKLGINAIDNLIKYYNEQQAYFNESHPVDDVLGEIVPVTSIIDGGEQINTVPDIASLTCRVRTTVAFDGKQLINDIQNIIDRLNEEKNVNLKLEILTEQDPVKSNPKSEFIQMVQKLAPNYLEQELPLMHVSGGTDASHFTKKNKNLPVAVIGPGNDTSHMINEYVDEDLYFKYIEFYKEIIKNY